MAGRGKRARTGTSSSRSVPRRQEPEPVMSADAEAEYRAQKTRYLTAVAMRTFNSEKVIVDFDNSPRFMSGIEHYGLHKLLEVPSTRRESIVGQYFIEYNVRRSRTFVMKGVNLPEITPEYFATKYNLRIEPNCRFAAHYKFNEYVYPMDEVLETITMPGHVAWEGAALKKACCPNFIKNWIHFLSSNVLPILRRSSINKKLMLLIHLIVREQPICFPTIMCDALHANIIDCKLGARDKTPHTAIAFPHLVTAFCEDHGVEFLPLDIESGPDVFSLLKDQKPEEYPPPLHQIDPANIALERQGSQGNQSQGEQGQSSRQVPSEATQPTMTQMYQLMVQMRGDFQAAEFKRIAAENQRDREMHRMQENLSRIMERLQIPEYHSAEEGEEPDE